MVNQIKAPAPDKAYLHILWLLVKKKKKITETHAFGWGDTQQRHPNKPSKPTVVSRQFFQLWTWEEKEGQSTLINSSISEIFTFE